MIGLSVCMSVGHVREPCKNGWIDKDAILSGGWLGWAHGTNHVLDEGPDPPRKGAILGAVWSIQKHWQSLPRCSQQKNVIPSSTTACTTWCGLWSKFFDRLLSMLTMFLSATSLKRDNGLWSDLLTERTSALPTPDRGRRYVRQPRATVGQTDWRYSVRADE